jgi:hypothetical protein
MIAVRARMAGAPEGQSWPAPGGESAIGERQSSDLRVGIDGGSWVVHPARITVTSNATKHPFIAAQTPVCCKINQA